MTDPTRKNNMLDLVLTNWPNFVIDVGVVDNLPFTDHDAVQFNLHILFPCPTNWILSNGISECDW